ncbi:MAG TPA: DUF2063 domain-containing protein [Gammaproteobacteria bacterium]|nr:DUF2063 domain-containing protein [Gammaproteobacteria bacterium]
MDQPEFQKVQIQFTAHVRDPKFQVGPVDVEDRRMKIYRELLFNNVENLMSGTFPVLKAVMAENWIPLIRDFFSTHKSTTPYFPQVPQELLRFLEAPAQQQHYPAWIWELAYYEWMELALAIDTRDIGDSEVSSTPNWQSEVPVISELAWPHAFRYPVHQISIDHLPTAAAEDPYYIVVYRTRQLEVNFLQMNAVSARLLSLIQDNITSGDLKSGGSLLEQLVAELHHPQPRMVIEAGVSQLDDFLQRGIVLGTKAIS